MAVREIRHFCYCMCAVTLDSVVAARQQNIPTGDLGGSAFKLLHTSVCIINIFILPHTDPTGRAFLGLCNITGDRRSATRPSGRAESRRHNGLSHPLYPSLFAGPTQYIAAII